MSAVHLLTYNLVRAVMAQAAFLGRVLPRQLSFKATLQLVRAFAEYLRHTLRGRLAVRRACLLAGISRVLLPHRADRFEPRAVKRRPKPTPFPTQPRHVLKTAILRQQKILHGERLKLCHGAWPFPS